MGELTSRVLQKIRDAQTFDDVDNFIWIAGELVRREASKEFHSGYKDIDEEEVSLEERDQLKDALLEALARTSEPRFVGSLLSALSATGDRDLLPLWVEHLAKYLEQLKASNAVVHSVLNALNDIGELEREIRPSGGRSAADVDLNIEEAQKYLLKRGIKVPW